MNWKIAFVFVACAAALVAQKPRVVTLNVDVENAVTYRFDVEDPAKRGANPNLTTTILPNAFMEGIEVDDIVAVNGKPAKGVHAIRYMRMNFSPTPSPGQAIADMSGSFGDCNWYFQAQDGKFVGQILDGGLTVPHVVKGGAGAFYAATGEHNWVPDPARPTRNASVSEDPSRRRELGGGRYRVLFYLVMESYPEVEMTSQGPAILHADDWSLVNPTRPARAGELLVMRARNLGPTTPAVPPNQPFPKWTGDPLVVVNSDVEVTVNGAPAEVLVKAGWPSEVGVYRVDFRMPSGVTPGMAALQLTAAWIPSEEVKIPVR